MTTKDLDTLNDEYYQQEAKTHFVSPEEAQGLWNGYQAGFLKALTMVQDTLKNWEGEFVGEFPQAFTVLQPFQDLLNP